MLTKQSQELVLLKKIVVVWHSYKLQDFMCAACRTIFKWISRKLNNLIFFSSP